jgi:hypothetical protein
MAEAPVAIGYYRGDRDGRLTLYPLTTCCAASGKGSETETGVCCRSCYRTVDSAYGGFWHVDDSPEMLGKFNIAGTWADYTNLLVAEGVSPSKADELTTEAKRQAGEL